MKKGCRCGSNFLKIRIICRSVVFYIICSHIRSHIMPVHQVMCYQIGNGNTSARQTESSVYRSKVMKENNKISQSISKHSNKTSYLKNSVIDVYDSEAAQHAFFNAPKVSRRQFVRRSASKSGTEDDQESVYNENNELEFNSKIAGFMQEFISKKITANNAFETQIFEKLTNVVEVESLQCVGTMLDASARVYAFRVDNTHGECFTVRTTINESRKKGTSKNDTATNKNIETASNSDEDGYSAIGENDLDQYNQKNHGPKRTKQKISRLKESKFVEQPGHIDDLLKRATNLAAHFDDISLSDEVIDEKEINNAFDHYTNQMDDLSTLRRVKIPFINEKVGNINRINEEYGIDDPMYNKVAKKFEEGCTQSFINNEVLTNQDGTFLILHTNWKDDEPRIAPKAAEFSTESDPLFDRLEGSLERALSREPCSLAMLQNFCEEDSDMEDNSFEEVRPLGRPSQTFRRLTQDQIPELRESTVEHQNEAPSIFGIMEENKSRKANEELAKIQIFLDDEDKMPTKKDPFDDEDFFSNDFSELLLQDTSESDIHKATFHSFSDDAAAIFGIPSELMAEIRVSLKQNQVISEELEQKLFDVMGSENRNRLEFVLETKDLTKHRGNRIGNEIIQPLDFFMTRFAPLIDSIWHSIIKKANEEQLCKVGFYFGSKGIPRTTTRLGTSAIKSSTKKRKVPYITPLKTPAQPSSMVTPESITISPLSMSNFRLTTKRQPSSVKNKPVSRLKFSGETLSTIKEQGILLEVSDEDNVYPDISAMTQVSMTSSREKNSVYFWARPREYPKVYLDQVLDYKDNPMQAADLLDMDELLGLNDQKMRSTSVNKPINNAVNSNPVDESNTLAIKEMCENVENTQQLVKDQDNHSAGFGDEFQLDFEVGQVESTNKETLEAEKNAKVDILHILNQSVVSSEEELMVVEEVVNDSVAFVKQETAIEDDSHWKGGPSVTATVETEAVKKSKIIKPKRQKADSQNQTDLECATQKVKALNSQFKTSVLTRLPDDGKVEVVGTSNFSDVYDPVVLINRSLLYKRKSGYWKNTLNGPEYVKLRSGYAVRTVEEERLECMGESTIFSAKKKKADSARERLTPKTHDIDISPGQMRSNSPAYEEDLGDDKDEQLEFNGNIIKIRQSRVNPPMVKRAIMSVLASKETDLNAMLRILESFPPSRIDLDLVEDNKNLDVYDSFDESDGEEEQEQSVLSDNSSSAFKIEGDHHFSNLCAYLPDHLFGRTKRDLNVINTFAITLIMCNENNLCLVQEVDPQTKLVTENGMSDFKIGLAKQ